MTNPGDAVWRATDPAFSRSAVSALIGSGDDVWNRVRVEVLEWRVKTASGFSVAPADRVHEGCRVMITAQVLGLTIIEPVEVVTVVDTADRAGFAYRTLPGHPVSGEEAFIVHRRGAEVLVTIRSLTRPAQQQPWRMLYPLLRIAQVVVRRRYLRALRAGSV